MATLSQRVDALTAAVAALVAAQSAPRQPKAESPAQTTWRTRSAGTCVSCGRSDFRTHNGALSHILSSKGETCVRTEKRDAGFTE